MADDLSHNPLINGLDGEYFGHPREKSLGSRVQNLPQRRKRFLACDSLGENRQNGGRMGEARKMDDRIVITDKAQLRTEFEGLYDALLAKVVLSVRGLSRLPSTALSFRHPHQNDRTP